MQREEIRKRILIEGRPKEPNPVEAFGILIHLRYPDWETKQRLNTAAIDPNEGGFSIERYLMGLVVECAIDEAGEKIFTTEDYAALVHTDGVEMEKITRALMEMVGMTKAAVDAAAKLLRGIQSGDGFSVPPAISAAFQASLKDGPGTESNSAVPSGSGGS